MSIQSFYEYVILRDILAFILPGGISLAGIYMIMHALGHALGIEQWEKSLPFLSNLDPLLQVILLLLVSFLVGHIWDKEYRVRYQTHKDFQRIKTIEKILIGNPASESKSVDNHIANQICSSVGQFLNIDWKKTPIEKWIESEKAFDLSVLLSYWIEEEDPKIFGDEIARPLIQSHLLHVCGMAFRFFGACVLVGEVVHLFGEIVGWFSVDILREPFALFLWTLIISSFPLWILILAVFPFGKALINQGIHKRDIIVEHVFRVFHVIWQKRVLAHEDALEIARHGGSPNKINRSKKAKP
jgi:hypothetical protein